MKLLLYGANGYTGKIIAEYAKKYGVTPILAGRTASKVKPLADQLGYEYRIFGLDDKRMIEQNMGDITVVLHAAGPFSKTAEPMMRACISTMCHYLDLTGEIEIFELAHSLDEEAKRAGIMLMSGVGFDIVPTDCLAKHLKQRMPDATKLELAFASIGGGVSRGTAMTMVENLGDKGAERKDGNIVQVPVGLHTTTIPGPKKKLFAMSIPWGDVSTAYYSTSIPNIITYMGVPPSAHKFVKLQRYLNWILRTDFIKNMLRKQIDKRPAGPTLEQRKTGKTIVFGKVTNKSGLVKKSRLITPEGYELTAIASLVIAKKVLDGKLKIGFQTPSNAYGADLIMEMPNVTREDL